MLVYAVIILIIIVMGTYRYHMTRIPLLATKVIFMVDQKVVLHKIPPLIWKYDIKIREDIMKTLVHVAISSI